VIGATVLDPSMAIGFTSLEDTPAQDCNKSEPDRIIAIPFKGAEMFKMVSFTIDSPESKLNKIELKLEKLKK
jgi:hypothetical protein